MADDDALAASIRTLLVDVARERRTLTYDDLVAAAPDARHDVAPLLRRISTGSDEAGNGLLSAVVVRADTGLPGTGFFTLAAERGRDVSDRQAAWEREVAAVYAAAAKLAG